MQVIFKRKITIKRRKRRPASQAGLSFLLAQVFREHARALLEQLDRDLARLRARHRGFRVEVVRGFVRARHGDRRPDHDFRAVYGADGRSRVVLDLRRIQERLGKGRLQLAVVRGQLKLQRPGDHDRGLFAGQALIRSKEALGNPVDDPRPGRRLDAGVIPCARSGGRHDVIERLIVVVVERDVQPFDDQRRKLPAGRQVVGAEFAHPQVGHDAFGIQRVQDIAGPRVVRHVAEAFVQFHDLVVAKVVERHGNGMVFRIDFAADIFPLAVRILEHGKRGAGVFNDIGVVSERQLAAVGRHDFARSLEIVGEVADQRIRGQPVGRRVSRILAQAAVDPVDFGHQREIARVRRAQEPGLQVFRNFDRNAAVLRTSVRIPVDDVAVVIAPFHDSVRRIGNAEQQLRIRVILRHAVAVLGGRFHDGSFRERQGQRLVEHGVLGRQRLHILGVDLHGAGVIDINGIVDRRAFPHDLDFDRVVLVLFQTDIVINETVLEVRTPFRFGAVNQHLRRALGLDVEVNEVFVHDDLVAYGRLRRQHTVGRSFAYDLQLLRRARPRRVNQLEVVRVRSRFLKLQPPDPNDEIVPVAGVIVVDGLAVDRARDLGSDLRRRHQIQAQERGCPEIQIQLRRAAAAQHDVIRRLARDILSAGVNEIGRQRKNLRENLIAEVRRIRGRERLPVVDRSRMEPFDRRDVRIDDVNFKLLRNLLLVAGRVKRNAFEQNRVLAVNKRPFVANKERKIKGVFAFSRNRSDAQVRLRAVDVAVVRHIVAVDEVLRAFQVLEPDEFPLDVQRVRAVLGVERIRLSVVEIFYINIAFRSVSDRCVIRGGRAVVIKLDLLDAAGKARDLENLFVKAQAAVVSAVYNFRQIHGRIAERQIVALQILARRAFFRANKNIKARSRYFRSVQRHFAYRFQIGPGRIIRQIIHFLNGDVARQKLELPFIPVRSSVINDNQVDRLVGVYDRARRFKRKRRELERHETVRRRHAVHAGNFRFVRYIARQNRLGRRPVDAVSRIVLKRGCVVRHQDLRPDFAALRRGRRAVRQGRHVVQKRIFGPRAPVLHDAQFRKGLIPVEIVERPHHDNRVRAVGNLERQRIEAGCEIQRRRVKRSVRQQGRDDRRAAVQAVGDAGRIFDRTLDGNVLFVHDNLRALVQHDRARRAAHNLDVLHVRHGVVQHIEGVGPFYVALHAGEGDFIEAGEKREIASRKAVGRTGIRRHRARHDVGRVRHIPGRSRRCVGRQHFDLDRHAGRRNVRVRTGNGNRTRGRQIHVIPRNDIGTFR